MNNSFVFWYRFLLLVNVITLLVAILIAFMGNTAIFDFYNSAIANLLNEGEPLSGSQLNMKNWLFGIIGGTMAGFNILCLFILIHAFKKAEIWAWWALFTGITLWFVIDSYISIILNAYFNVYWINIPALLSFYIPLIITKKQFNIKNNEL